MKPGALKSTVEEAAFSGLEELGYTIRQRSHNRAGEMFAERSSYSDVVLIAADLKR